MAEPKLYIAYQAAIIIVLIFAVLFLYQYMGAFVVSEDDLTSTGLKSEIIVNPGESYDSFSNFSIINNTINFIIAGQTKNYDSPIVFFMLDDLPTISNSFYDVTEGMHTIKKYQMTIINNQTQINIQKWQKTYDIIIKTVYVNVTVPNETFYVDKPINVTVTQYVNQTVEKIVTAEPDINAWIQKYQTYLIAIVGIGIVYYLTRVRKK